MGERVFEGPAGPAMGPRLFGGQAIAQALMAGCAAEDGGRLPNSLHAHFLKAGASTDRVRYTVTTLSQGRSFAVRRIDGMQGDTLIFSMTASFHIQEAGHEHATPSPFDLDIDAALSALEDWRSKSARANDAPLVDRLQKRPIEIVPLEPDSLFGAGASKPHTAVWMRMRCSPMHPT